MNHRLLIGAAVVAALCVLPLGLAAQQAAGAPEKDPDAMAALEKMGAYLRTIKSFQVVSKQDRDDVLVDGQKVENESTADWELVANLLTGEIRTGRHQRAVANTPFIERRYRLIFLRLNQISLWEELKCA